MRSRECQGARYFVRLANYVAEPSSGRVPGTIVSYGQGNTTVERGVLRTFRRRVDTMPQRV
jgi:hypothetical protein